MISQSDFEYAREHPTSRKDFVASIDLEEAKPFVRGALYKDRGLFSDRFIMKCVPSLPPFFGIKGTKSDICVYQKAFDKGHTPDINEFLSKMIDHEGMHARQLFTNPAKYFNPILDIPRLFLSVDVSRATCYLREHECFSNQLANAKRRNLTRIYEEVLALEVGGLHGIIAGVIR